MKKTTDEALTYDAAMTELEQIVSQLQSPECAVDRLCELTKRAIQLLQFCKQRLAGTDQELAQLLEHLD